MRRFLSWFADAAKFGATVGVYYLLDLWSIDFDDPAKDALQGILIAAIAGLITAITVDLLFGRPLLRLEWQQGGRAIPDRCPDLQLSKGQKTILRLDVHLDGDSTLAKIVQARSRRNPLVLTLTLVPHDTARCVRQTGSSAAATLASNVIRFDLTGGVFPGNNGHLEFSVSPRAKTTAPNKVTLHLKLGSSTGKVAALPLLIRRDKGLEAFVIGG